MKFDHIENGLSDIESSSELYGEERKELETRESALNKALDKVDAALAKVLEKNMENLQKRKAKVERSVRKCRKDLEKIVEELAEMQEETEKSERVIHNLKGFGLYVADSEGILQYRRQMIQRCGERIQALTEQLDALGRQSETRENSGQEAKNSTLSSREEFSNRLRVSVPELQPKKTDSSSSNWGDPNIGPKILDKKTETSMEI